ncbi:MAG: TonB C-terminal domain-containing protein [Gemmatimonadales bacterium]|nr:TonB C-terminal domain-containing protein [Gemmatimonadales bacterium]
MRVGLTPRESQQPGVAAGFVGTVLVHVGLVLWLLLAVTPPMDLPPVYAVELVAAPRPVRQARSTPEVVERPAERPAPVEPDPTPADPDPDPVPPPPAEPVDREPPPRTAAPVEPAPGETPSTGADVATVKTPGLVFPYPEYLRNIVTQVYRLWDRPRSKSALEAEIFFLIDRDGSVREMRFISQSGNFSFDLSAQGAIEAAGNAKAFGPLPDGFGNDVLPVSFFFSPRPSQ